MDAREYLNQIQRYDKIRRNKLEELEYLESLAQGIKSFSYDSERVQTSGPCDKIGETVAKIVDLKNDIIEITNKCLEVRIEVTKTIDSVTNSVFYDILFKRYAEGKSLDVIADEVGYSYQRTKELHLSAIAAVKKIKGFES